MALNELEAKKRIESHLPSQRALAAEWFRSNASPHLTHSIVEALEAETVPIIRSVLADALKGTQAVGRETADATSASSDSDNLGHLTTLLDDLATLIRHETEPAIGWLRRAASKEIIDFDSSETNIRIETLRQRIKGLSTLASAHRVPHWVRLSLSDIIQESTPAELLPEDILTQDLVSDNDEIYSDRGLLILIIENALRNATEAVAEISAGEAGILLRCGVNEAEFWLTITNRFRGESFDFEHVAHTGASNKVNHKGLGVNAMRLAAKRLDYDLSLSASAGTAFFSLRGPRFRD